VDYQQAARDHLWLRFTRMSGYYDEDVPIIVRGDARGVSRAKFEAYTIGTLAIVVAIALLGYVAGASTRSESATIAVDEVAAT